MVGKGILERKEQLRKQFLASPLSQSDEAILELLLSTALPNRDVKPIVDDLIHTYGNLPDILSSDYKLLCKVNGIKENTATLIKLVDWVRKRYPKEPSFRGDSPQHTISEFQSKEELVKQKKATSPQEKVVKKPPERKRTGLFNNSLLKESIDILPKLPETYDIDKLRTYIKDNLHFNSVETRSRYGSYIVKRMFQYNDHDKSLIRFAKQFDGRQELKDVCFYRFCKAEPLMYTVYKDVISPAMGYGQIDRARIREYLSNIPASQKTLKVCVSEISYALSAAGIAKSDTKKIMLRYRDIPLAALAFVIYSEFPEPGMYDIAKLEKSDAVGSLLWNPDKLLPSLYELRNRGIISKVSEIDSIRQFTISYDLETIVDKLVKGAW